MCWWEGVVVVEGVAEGSEGLEAIIEELVVDRNAIDVEEKSKVTLFG
jgi:hypothetical protein